MPALQSLKPRIALLGASPTGGFASPSRGTRQERGYGSAWDRIRLQILKRDRYTCQPHKRAGFIHSANIVDHIVPKAEGGPDDESNLEAVCSAYHREKTQREANRNR